MRTVTVLGDGSVKGIAGRQRMPGVAAAGARHVAGTVPLIQDDHAMVVADPGMVTDRALMLEGLAKAGVAPAAVTHIVISHHHPDHTVNLAWFPNAEVVDCWASYRGARWQDHADEYAIVPGSTVLRTPGHTDEEASLMVRADDGTDVLTPLWWLEDRTPATDPLAWDQAQLDASRQKVLASAEGIIPGHGRPCKKPPKGQP